MSNHQDWVSASSKPYSAPPQPPLRPDQKVISTLILLTLGYYAFSFFDVSLSTLKRILFEWFLWVIPNRLVYLTEHLLHRLRHQPRTEPLYSKQDFGNNQAKIRALQRIFGDTSGPVKQIIHQARKMSGFDYFVDMDQSPKPSGLQNYECSCYQNSILQCLASLPAFLSSLQERTESLKQFRQPTTLHNALDILLKNLNDISYPQQQRPIVTPRELKALMNPKQQEDAHEYFVKLLESLDDEAGLAYARIKKKPGLESIRKRKFEEFEERDRGDLPIKSPASVESPFDGWQCDGAICTVCYGRNLKMECFNCLTIRLGRLGDGSLDVLVEEYTTPQTVEGVNCEDCTRIAQAQADRVHTDQAKAAQAQAEHEEAKQSDVGLSEADLAGVDQADAEVGASDQDLKTSMAAPRVKVVQTEKQTHASIARLPTDLVFLVERGMTDNYNRIQKNYANVNFPATFGFQHRWGDLNPVGFAEHVVRKFDLRAAVVHAGSHEGGHYVAYGKRGKDWYWFSDEVVNRVEIEEVLSRGKDVHMLFYEELPEGEQPRLDSEGMPFVGKESEASAEENGVKIKEASEGETYGSQSSLDGAEESNKESSPESISVYDET